MPDAPAPKNTLYERRTRSSRRLTPLRRLLYRIALPFAIVLVRFWWLACRIVRIVGEEHVAAALASGPVVPVLWHQHQLFCARFLLAQRDRGLVPGFLISPSVDGELPAMVARHSGVHVLRGSSSSDGARVLRDYLMALKQGVSPVINPDGPFGPRSCPVVRCCRSLTTRNASICSAPGTASCCRGRSRAWWSRSARRATFPRALTPTPYSAGSSRWQPNCTRSIVRRARRLRPREPAGRCRGSAGRRRRSRWLRAESSNG